MPETNLSATHRLRQLLLLVVAALIATVSVGTAAAGPATAAPTHHRNHHHHGCRHHHHHHHGCHDGRHHHRHHTNKTPTTTTRRTVHRAGPTVPARSAAESKIGQSLLAMLNKERAAHRLPALSMDSHLLLSARHHDLAMARANDMSHQVAGESDLGTRVTAAGYTWTWAGENIGWNSDMSERGVLQLEEMMYDEKPPNDGHRQNILSTHYRNIGVDVYFDQSNHKVWLTTDFGHH